MGSDNVQELSHDSTTRANRARIVDQLSAEEAERASERISLTNDVKWFRL